VGRRCKSGPSIGEQAATSAAKQDAAYEQRIAPTVAPAGNDSTPQGDVKII
jgi:hypothetical protein